MQFKLIVVIVKDEMTPEILEAVRDGGATGCTVINQARGEGIMPAKTFLGLSIDNHVDIIFLLVEEHMCPEIMKKIEDTGQFDETPGSGIAFQIDVENAIGVRHQIEVLSEVVGHS